MRTRKDGILEYIIGKHDEILEFLKLVEPYVIMKKSQVKLIKQILLTKKEVESQKDFTALIKLVDVFRELNYSKKRKVRALTP